VTEVKLVQRKVKDSILLMLLHYQVYQ